MRKQSKYKSEISEAIHSSVMGMYQAGTIDEKTMREFDESCLIKPPPMEPKEIKTLRKENHANQYDFAAKLNTSLSTVQKWETGAKRPSGMALKLLSLVQKHGLEILN